MAGRQHLTMVDPERTAPMTYVFLVRRARTFYGVMYAKGDRITIVASDDEETKKKLSRALTLSAAISGGFLLETTTPQAEPELTPAVGKHRHTLTRMTPREET